MATKEIINGEEKVAQADFRKYNSLADRMEDHAIFLQQDRYKSIIGNINYASVAQKLYEDGYSTSPVYPSSLLTFIEKYKLYQYDVKNLMRKMVTNIVAATLGNHEHIVVNCNSNASEGAAKANSANVDLFISLHMNASNGKGHGTEALVDSESSGSYPYAERLC